MPWYTYATLGPLDERFVGYGFEDNDYCARVFEAGLKIGIWDGCVVDHAHRPSVFRTRPNFSVLFEQNRQLYRSKWGRDS
jgi:GT2 family glycosyltransferase